MNNRCFCFKAKEIQALSNLKVTVVAAESVGRRARFRKIIIETKRELFGRVGEAFFRFGRVPFGLFLGHFVSHLVPLFLGLL